MKKQFKLTFFPLLDVSNYKLQLCFKSENEFLELFFFQFSLDLKYDRKPKIIIIILCETYLSTSVYT